MAVVGDIDVDDLALRTEKPTHGYAEPLTPAPHSEAAPRRVQKHWKQPFWKRRKAMRAEKNRLEQTIAFSAED